jgi:hypothetical protein
VIPYLAAAVSGSISPLDVLLSINGDDVYNQTYVKRVIVIFSVWRVI